MIDLPASVTAIDGEGGLRAYRIETQLATATIYEQGAHLTSWIPADKSEVLWVSSHSKFEEGTAIRGGVPICAPWFGGRDDKGYAHGFARVRPWSLDSASEERGVVTLVFSLTNDDIDETYPADLTFNYQVRIGADLQLSLAVNSTQETDVEAALHTYFAVPDIEKVTITGLESAPYFDKVTGSAAPATNEAITFTGETDRVYEHGSKVQIHADRDIQIRQTGAANTVVWNPWVDKAAAMADFGDDEWREMVCVETANVGTFAYDLPGEGLPLRALIRLL